MNIGSLITIIRKEIEKCDIKCYSPDLPHNDNKCCAISLGTGTNTRALGKDILYSDIPFYLLIRGTTDDGETRSIADIIFKKLDHRDDLENDDLDIILISCSTPNYAFRDENQRIYYNINATVKVAWKEG